MNYNILEIGVASVRVQSIAIKKKFPCQLNMTEFNEGYYPYGKDRIVAVACLEVEALEDALHRSGDQPPEVESEDPVAVQEERVEGVRKTELVVEGRREHSLLAQLVRQLQKMVDSRLFYASVLEMVQPYLGGHNRHSRILQWWLLPYDWECGAMGVTVLVEVFECLAFV